MKSLSALLIETLLLLILMTISCEKEDKNLKDQVTGTWNVLTEKYTEYKNNVITYEGTDSYGPGEMVLEFNSDGTGEILEDGEMSDTFTWEITKGLLILNSASEGRKIAEVSVDGDTLNLKITAESTFDDITYKAVSNLILTRA